MRYRYFSGYTLLNLKKATMKKLKNVFKVSHSRIQVFLLVVLLATVFDLHQYAFQMITMATTYRKPTSNGNGPNTRNAMNVLILNDNRPLPQIQTNRTEVDDTEEYHGSRNIRETSFEANNFRRKFCKDHVTWRSSRFLSPVTSEMDYWSFDIWRKCENLQFDETFDQPMRLRVSLNCKTSGVALQWTKRSSNVYRTSSQDKCLEDYIDNCCTGNYKVPNIVHYVWYSRGELSFVGFASLISVIRFVNPCLIIFHGDSVPFGKYWDLIINISPNIIHLKRKRPTEIFGKRIIFKEHSGDIMRIQALLKYGGIYMDTDTVLVRSIDILRNHSYLMSTQVEKLGSAFIMAEKNATFLEKWMEGYQYFYDRDSYVYNAMTYPKLLAHFHSELIHIEQGTISRPKDMIGRKFYSRRYATYNWAHVYGFHLFTRSYRGVINETTIRTMNSACGSVLRHVVYGNKDFCLPS